MDVIIMHSLLDSSQGKLSFGLTCNSGIQNTVDMWTKEKEKAVFTKISMYMWA